MSFLEGKQMFWSVRLTTILSYYSINSYYLWVSYLTQGEMVLKL